MPYQPFGGTITNPHSLMFTAGGCLTNLPPSTLFKYINTLQCIHSILLEFAWTWHDIGRHHLSDLLQIAHEGKHTEWSFGATTAIKALRWAQKLLLISEWQMLYDPIVNSFFNSSNHERRESVPLSLFLVSQWERRILMKECSLQEQILLGGFLCLLWGGLRFADGQRVSLQSLSWCITALRGSCYRTKTSRSGQTLGHTGKRFLVPRHMVVGGPMAYGPGHFMVPSSQCNF